MRDRLDFNDLPTSLAERLTPSARVADTLLRQTLAEGGFERFLEGGPCLIVVHGARPDDATVLVNAVQDLVGGTGKLVVQLNASARDWTEPGGQRPQYVERLLMDASLSTRPQVVFCRMRSAIPGVVATVADAGSFAGGGGILR